MRRLPALLALLLLGLPGVARPAAEEELPTIYLEKRVFAESTPEGKNFYEVHEVVRGESLWKILARRHTLDARRFSRMLREFRRVNPEVKSPDRLRPGQKILVPALPAGSPLVAQGRAEAVPIRRGDTLTGLLAARGVSREEMKRHLRAAQEINPSLVDPDRIFAGDTMLLPTRDYFRPEVPPTGLPEVALTREAPPAAGAEPLPPARPDSQLPGKTEEAGEKGVLVSGAGRETGAAQGPGSPRAWRGLISDLARGLGETWVDRGTLYLPIPSGGEVVVRLDEYPVIRGSNGIHVLLDFRGGLPADVRDLIAGTFDYYRVVVLADAGGADGSVSRVLSAAGYHSVKEGIGRPLVIGEEVAVSLPARWIVLRTEQSLARGEVVLLKEVPERPGKALSAVLRYAERVGIRVLPYAADPAAGEGFLVGIGEETEPLPAPETRNLPPAGLPAFDAAARFLDLPVTEGETIRIGGGEGSFRLSVQPARIFEAGGKRHAVDDGRMSGALRSLLSDAGYSVFPVGPDEPARRIAERLLAAAGIPHAVRKAHRVAGGDGEGFEVTVSGTFLEDPGLLGRRGVREAAFVRGRVHAATALLLRELGVEIAGW